MVNQPSRQWFGKKNKLKKGDQKPQRLDVCTGYDLNLGKPRSKTNPHLMIKTELEFRDLQIASPRAARERRHPLALFISRNDFGQTSRADS